MALGKVIGVVSCCVLFGAYAAPARQLCPMKPSQVVVLVPGGATDPCTSGVSGGRGFQMQQNPDGQRVPFQIPAGQVLVAAQVTVSVADFSVSSPQNRA